ncbi:putative secreted protein (Por secretion system target) [Lutibacter sp. Hel_I_33_5]|uniref:LamG-like jellyroll fold domain-containing protein n=1 Tax=Lutibacter sp. Hel_I_33_5 TaxID=1566289 RepID=UPI0011A24163|nr:LamG-like jellyroll fold domain-containing protein [Lutibacter sp. Hel_I_33_5]TVZ57260.1 putative secreted protein (Por secretion system target) [Lutibacter sp. Hel_I_33_5]
MKLLRLFPVGNNAIFFFVLALLLLTNTQSFSQTIPGTGSSSAICGNCNPIDWQEADDGIDGTPDISNRDIAGGEGFVGAGASWNVPGGQLPLPPTGDVRFITLRDIGGDGFEENVETNITGLIPGKIYKLRVFSMTARTNANGGSGNNAYYAGTYLNFFEYQFGTYQRVTITNVSQDVWSQNTFIFVADATTMRFRVFPGADATFEGTPEGVNWEALLFSVDDVNAIEVLDSDGDTVDDSVDIDDDNDGIPDTAENSTGTDPSADADNDGVPNYLDSDNNGSGGNLGDVNNDGVQDHFDFDLDGIPNHLDLDADNDGILDNAEAQNTGFYTAPAGNVGANGLYDVYEDVNESGISNLPLTNTDSNGNPDYIDIDSDNDGIPDNVEAQTTTGYVAPSGVVGSNGVYSIYENNDTYNPTALNPTNTDLTDEPDYRDSDSDNDGTPDLEENGMANTASGTDTDGDGLDDSFEGSDTTDYDSNDEIDTPASSILPDSDTDVNTVGDLDYRDTVNGLDTDGDGIPDSVDIDDDNDGILDTDEGCVNNPSGPPGSIGANFGINSGLLTINDGIISDNLGVHLNGNGEYFVLDLGGIIPSGTTITFHIWKNNTGAKQLRVAELTNATQDLGNGTNPFIIDQSVIATNVTAINYVLDSNTQYIQVEMINRSGGRFEVAEAVVGAYFSCTRDTDGDGIVDSLDLDSDNDGIIDNREAQTTAGYVAPTGAVGANGLYDIYEDVNESGISNLPIPNSDTDASGTIPDYLDIDSDNDGIPDNIEAQLTLGYVAPSGTVGVNGLDNAYDFTDNYNAVGLTPTNTDNLADEPDYRDTDADEDGTPDIQENGMANAVTGTDSDGDGLDDAFEGGNSAANEPWDANDDIDTPASSILPDVDTDVNSGGDLDYRDNLAGIDTDGDGIVNSIDIDDDNDGILDTVEDASNSCIDGTSVGTAFTSLGQARSVSSAGVYFFNLNGNQFSTYVDANGFVQIAVDFGNGAGNLPQGTALTDAARGILNPTILATLTDATSVRVSHSGGLIDATSTDATYLSRITSNISLHRGNLNDGNGDDNTLNNSWSGTGATELTVNANCSSGSNFLLHQKIIHPCGNVNGFTWFPNADHQRTLWNNGEIPANESLSLWVQAANVSLPSCNDFDGDGIINSLDLDSDNDGILDNIEAQTTAGYVAPSGGVGNNGLYASYEDNDTPGAVSNLPLTNTDANGNPDYLDIDSDNDGIPDNIEAQTTQSYVVPTGNVGSNGVDSAYENNDTFTATGLSPNNHDNTDLPDYRDLDSDNDGTPDIEENGMANTASGTDTDGDGLDDSFEGGNTNDYDVNDEINNPLSSILPDVDGDANAAGDLDYRDTTSDIDTDGDGIPDSVDIDDDNDGIPDSIENSNCLPSVPNYEAHYSFDSTTDDSTTNHNLVNNPGALSYSTNAVRGSHSVSFNGSYLLHYSTNADFLEKTIQNFTHSFWVNPSSVTGTQFLLDEGGNGNGVAIRLNGNVLEAAVRENNVQQNLDTSSLTTLNVGTWYNITLTYANGNVTLYLDGVATPTLSTGYGTLAQHTDNSGFGGANASNAFGSAGSNFFTGLMDEFAYYETALTTTQVNLILGCDTDGDGIINSLDIDADGDGIPDNIEAQTSAGYVAPSGSVGANGLYDIYEDVNDSGTTNLPITNTDNTDTPDYLDLDSDNDGTPDIEENGMANTASGTDSDGDGLDDAFEGINSTAGENWDSNDDINNPLASILPDTDGDSGSGQDLDYRDDSDDSVDPAVMGNTLWLRADIGVTGGATVTDWEDQTTSNADFTGAGTPDNTVTANNLNFNPVVTFNNGADFLTYTGNLNPGSMYIVYNDTSTAGFTTAFTNNDGDGIGHGFTDDSQLYDATFTPAEVRDGTEYVNGFAIDFTTRARPDNYELHSRIFDSNPSNAGHTYYVGRDRTNNTRGITGSVAEVMLFSTQHTDVERQQVESYLAIKYGFTLDETNTSANITEGDYILYDNTTTTTIWDRDANSTYHNDVAGIGRYDALALMQKQSSSVNSDGIITIGHVSIADSNPANNNNISSNNSFLVWGNNNSSLTNTTTTEIVCAPEKQLDRVWKVVETGNIGLVEVAVPVTNIDSQLNTPSTLKVLKVADDSNFTTNLEYYQINTTKDITQGGNTVSNYVANVDFNGTKYFTYSEINGIFWNGDTNAWTGGAGNANGPSDETSDVDKVLIIDAEATLTHASLTENAVVECVWVKANSKLTIANDNYLWFDEDFILDGEIRLIGDAQIIQRHTGNNNVQGDGKIYRDQASNLPNTYRYNYWSSPVVAARGATSFTVASVMKDGSTPTSLNSSPKDINFIPYTNLASLNGAQTDPITIASYWIFSYFNGVTRDDWAQKGHTNPVNIGEGYIMKSTGRNPQNFTFVGSPNDGDINKVISPGTASLLGNPYPSNINTTTFIADNTNVIDGTLYFWEHKGESTTTDPQAEGHGKFGYEGGYSQRNQAMGVAANSVIDGTAGLGNHSYTEPDQFIAVGQGFFVSANLGGTIRFRNSQRDFGSNNIFFRTNNEIKTLKLGFDYTNENNFVVHRQLGLNFKEGNTFAYESGFDSAIFDLQANDLFWKFPEAESNLVIAGIGKITQDMRIPLGLNVITEDPMHVMIDEKENMDGYDIYLVDLVTGQIFDLTRPVSLTLPKGTYTERFIITFGGAALGTGDLELSKNINIYSDNSANELVIKNNSNNLINNVEIFNLLGRKVSSWKNIKGTYNKLNTDFISSSIYIVNITTDKGKISKKLIIN